MRLFGKLLNKYPAYTEKEIINRIEKYSIISFDIFDTLVKRTVPKPISIFESTAEIYKNKRHIDVNNFVKARVRAEVDARQKALDKGVEEININDIYDSFSVDSGLDLKELKEIEIKKELECCIANPIMKEVYDWCRETNKIIYIISDMYLPKNIIETILANCGYEKYTKLFLSSEFKVQKKNGKLYDIFLKYEKIDPAEVIHIGDNFRSDYISAKKCGLNAIKIARDQNLTKFSKSRHINKKYKNKYRELLLFFNNCIDKSWNVYYQYGFEVMGPLIYSFITKTYQIAKDQKADKVLFMARDGYLILKAYKSLFGDLNNPKYFYVSRSSICRSILWMDWSFKDFLSLQNKGRKWNCLSLCYRCGIDSDIGQKKWEEVGLDVHRDYSFDELLSNGAEIFYKYFKSTIAENSKKMYSAFYSYLMKLGFDQNILLVDSGGSCTSQKYLEKIRQYNKICKPMHGLYLWKSGNPEREIDMEVYPYAAKQKDLWQTELLEFAMTSFEGSVCSYSDIDGKIEPLLDEFEYRNCPKIEKIINEIQQGTLQCIKYLAKWKNCISLDEEVSGYNGWRLSCFPSLAEANMFYKIDFFNDNTMIPLIHECNKHTLNAFIDGYKKSYWKMGYIKKHIKLPIPYYTLKSIIKKLNNRG